jgi:hypothetical protein
MPKRPEQEPQSRIEVKLVSQMTEQDFEKLAETSGGIVDRDVTIDGHLAMLRFPSLNSTIQFAKADPNSMKVDSIIFTDWRPNGFFAFLKYCAIVSNNKSTSFVAQKSVRSPVEIITITKKEVIRSKKYPRAKDMRALDPNIQKAMSLTRSLSSS